jgi:hypothetical protein
MSQDKSMTIEIDEDTEEITPLYDTDSYPHGPNITDVEAYWSDNDIQDAVAEMNDIEPSMVKITRV